MDAVVDLKSWQTSGDYELTDVSVERLRRHFSQTYKLNDDQVDFMVKSSVQSLQTVFESADQALTGIDVQLEPFVKIAHSLKGLLLNMGEPGWADIARSMEVAARAGESRDYAFPLAAIRKATSALIQFGT